MKNKILVITSADDAHANFLCRKMEKRGLRIFRFDTDSLKRFEVCFRIAPDCFSIKDIRRQRAITKEEIGSVWYRRPAPDKATDRSLDEVSVRYCRGEGKEWVKSITFALKNSFWVTAPWILYEARIKANQLFAARNVGLNVPKTLIAKDKRVIREFFDECQHGIVAKPLKMPYVESKDSYYTLSTQEITRRDLADRRLYVAPCMFQERIAVAHELRIVAIGKKLFAFRVTAKGKGRQIDIRVGGLGNVSYAPCEISRDLGKRILRMLEYFCVPFSSMDFLVDRDGKEYFVDLNPNGQWLWLEFLTGVVMSDVFAEMLATRSIPA